MIILKQSKMINLLLARMYTSKIRNFIILLKMILEARKEINVNINKIQTSTIQSMNFILFILMLIFDNLGLSIDLKKMIYHITVLYIKNN